MLLHKQLYFLRYDLQVGVRVVIGSGSLLAASGYVRHWNSIKGKGEKKGKFSSMTSFSALTMDGIAATILGLAPCKQTKLVNSLSGMPGQ